MCSSWAQVIPHLFLPPEYEVGMWVQATMPGLESKFKLATSDSVSLNNSLEESVEIGLRQVKF